MKVILYMAMTLNGYVAKEDDNVDFTKDSGWEFYESLMKRCGNLVIGRRTYEVMGQDEFFDDCIYVVVTTDNDFKSEKENILVAETPDGALRILKEKGAEEVFLGGGGTLNTSFLKENLVDEIILDVEPTIFGRGIQLFKQDDFEAKLELLEVNKLNNQTMQLHYRVQK